MYQEISRVSALLGNASILQQNGLEDASPRPSRGIYSNGVSNVSRWASPFQTEMSRLMQSSSAQNWLVPKFNFVGRLLGPRGNSLKRVEATTDRRVLIKGRGSIKAPMRDESEDFFKKQQLSELAMLNSTLREEGYQTPSKGKNSGVTPEP